MLIGNYGVFAVSISKGNDAVGNRNGGGRLDDLKRKGHITGSVIPASRIRNGEGTGADLCASQIHVLDQRAIDHIAVGILQNQRIHDVGIGELAVFKGQVAARDLGSETVVNEGNVYVLVNQVHSAVIVNDLQSFLYIAVFVQKVGGTEVMVA